MGILDSLSSQPKEKRWQCLFRDDDVFWFVKREMEDSFLIERGKNKEVIRGWKHLYGNQFPCPGYKQAHIPPCSVTFSHPRDIIFQVVPGIVPAGDRPDGGRHAVVPGARFSMVAETERLKEVLVWCASVGNQRLLRIAAKKSRQPAMDRLIMWLGIGFVIELFILLMLVGLKGGVKL